MLLLKPNCEHCNKDLHYDAEDAMICSFECTFCATCVDHVLCGVCPNCSGSFAPRPIRPSEMLDTYPPSMLRVHKPVDVAAHLQRVESKRSNQQGQG